MSRRSIVIVRAVTVVTGNVDDSIIRVLWSVDEAAFKQRLTDACTD